MAGDGVEDADGPGGAVEADPVAHCALVPGGHGIDACVPAGEEDQCQWGGESDWQSRGLPVCPDVLLGCDGCMVVQCGDDLCVGAGVFTGYVTELGGKFCGDLEL